MDFKLNEMEQEILDMLHDFCIKEVKPIAAELDEKEEFTQNAREKLAEMGMLGTYIPEEYGGAGLSYLTYIVCCEELAKYCASTSIMFSVHGFPVLLAHPGVRHRGAEAEVPGSPGSGREAGRYGSDRARRWYRRQLACAPLLS